MIAALQWLTLGLGLTSLGVGAYVVYELLRLRAASKQSMAYQRSRIPLIIAGCVFAGSTLGSLVVGDAASAAARDDLRRRLTTFSTASIVTIDGAQVNDVSQFLALLKQVRGVAGHHSRPTKRIEVTVREGGQGVTLVLARDSVRKGEYWVFVREPYSPGEIEVGRIATTMLDTY
jgi:hypothetical protein